MNGKNKRLDALKILANNKLVKQQKQISDILKHETNDTLIIAQNLQNILVGLRFEYQKKAHQLAQLPNFENTCIMFL